MKSWAYLHAQRHQSVHPTRSLVHLEAKLYWSRRVCVASKVSVRKIKEADEVQEERKRLVHETLEIVGETDDSV
ncbi:hypothetical protein F5Y08DRAFT_323841 [Xylaria arbuscula]|nr:hypothetical protein F5Y08DRAFT_323841 [Xylaria arbuscula]